MQEMLEAIGTLCDENMQYGQMPNSPDNVSLLNFSGGNVPKRTLGNSIPSIREPYIQLRVRNKSYTDCVSLINSYVDILMSVSGTYGDKKITKITMSGDIIPLGRDEKNRYDFTANFIIQIDNI